MIQLGYRYVSLGRPQPARPAVEVIDYAKAREAAAR
jgi:hypothetical protein